MPIIFATWRSSLNDANVDSDAIASLTAEICDTCNQRFPSTFSSAAVVISIVNMQSPQSEGDENKLREKKKKIQIYIPQRNQIGMKIKDIFNLK